jgi:hypothetical protein
MEDLGGFFDTELLVLAERAGLRIHEVPVDWADDPRFARRSSGPAGADLKGVWRPSARCRSVSWEPQLGRRQLETPVTGVPPVPVGSRHRRRFGRRAPVRDPAVDAVLSLGSQRTYYLWRIFF